MKGNVSPGMAAVIVVVVLIVVAVIGLKVFAKPTVGKPPPGMNSQTYLQGKMNDFQAAQSHTGRH